MEGLIKDLEQIWKQYKDHDDHARRDQMIVCLENIVTTSDIIKTKTIKILSEIR